MTHQPSALDGRVSRTLFGSWLSTLLAVLGVVAPKCPLCAAAYLGLLGVSASSARAVVALGVPLCVASTAVSAVATALFVARRGTRVAARVERKPTCCGSAR